MNLFYFGTAERQLFGAYHAPAANVSTRGAVLLCPPWGPEYFVAHRTLRQLAAQLAVDGYHVLRFDYFGTGDSAGERDEGDLASWVDDATVALDELQDVSGDSRIIVFGVRLGAIAAWKQAKIRSQQVRTVVLWDPVTDGKAYINELWAAQAEIDRASLTFRPSPDGSRREEVLGTPLPPRMAQSIANLSLDDFKQGPVPRAIVFFSDKRASNEALRSMLQAAETRLHTETIQGQTAWREETLTEGRIPNTAVERMVEVLR